MKRRAIVSGGLIPAAQYIRMSTEHQRFSPDSQRAANMAYAAANGFEIIATYLDSGKSGLTLKARPELKRLLSDVLSGTMPYRAILVLDVSRWGRFQDADQAAHYEYMCREAGIPVRYCSEVFDNDGGAMASIVKHMKRVMAAEYSRELSNKISKAQRLQAGMGYMQGGIAPFGTRRQVIDQRGRPKMLLGPGESKALSTDKVVFTKGPASEIATVRKIFNLYVDDGLKISEICARLGRRRKIGRGGPRWTRGMVLRVLSHDLYVGVYVFGRRWNNLGSPMPADPKDWSRADVLEPIISPKIFLAARERIERERRRLWTDEELKKGLRRLFAEIGFISKPEVNNADYLPHAGLFDRRFGSLANACSLMGYDKPLRASRHQLRNMFDQDLLDALVRIERANGGISGKIIDADRQTPRWQYFARRLGGLKAAFYRAGLTRVAPPPTRAGLKPDGGHYTDEELLDALRQLLQEHGYLSTRLINASPSVASVDTYGKRFRGLAEAYSLVGFCHSRSELHKLGWTRKIAGKNPK
ncbi:MAG: recombinase family protein [Sphingobium sp.]|nr:recombinase family protein [Sphingobium sp.]